MDSRDLAGWILVVGMMLSLAWVIYCVLGGLV
jgi:hypothetical protein